MTRLFSFGFFVALVATLTVTGAARMASAAADEPAGEGNTDAAVEPDETADKDASGEKSSGESSLVRIAKDSSVWIDPKRKIVVVDGEVVFREGQLEMFACPKGTKEHESVVAVHGKAYEVHAALLAVGAQVGNPVQFDPAYVPASGTEIDIVVLWTDKDGERHKDPAQSWIRDIKTDKPMTHKWVFAGSGFWTDEETGRRHYHAEGGDLICVSNFSTATLDLPVTSSQSNDALMFDALTKNIPPLGTKVRLVLIPNLKEEGEKEE